MKRSEVQSGEGVKAGHNGSKVVRSEGLLQKRVGNIRNYIQYFIPLVLFTFSVFLLTVVILCVFLLTVVVLRVLSS
jgi:hypothetical protein